MIVQSIHIKNFMSFGDEELWLDKPGLSLVLGKNKDSEQFDSNGAGKSTLFDALIWCLYGEILRPVPLDDLIRTGETEMEVTLHINDEAGVGEISIRRIRTNTKGKKSSRLVIRDNSGREMFPSTSITAMQEELDKFLGLDFKTFTNSVYFGKGLSQFFMVADDKTRKNILEAILQIVDFDVAYNKCKELYKEDSEELAKQSKQLGIIVSNIESKTQHKDSLIKEKEENKANAEKEAFDIQQSLLTIEAKAILFTSKIEGIKAKLDKSKAKYDKIKRDIEEAITSEIDMITELSKNKLASVDIAYKKDLATLTNNYNSLVSILKAKEAEARSEDAEIQMDFMSILKEENTNRYLTDAKKKNLSDINSFQSGALCYNCFSVISEDHKVDVASKILKELADLSVITEDIKTRLNKLRERAVKAKEKVSEFEKLKLEALTKFNNDKATQVSARQGVIDRINTTKAEECGQVRERYSSRLSQELLGYNNVVNEFKEELATLNAENNQLATQKTLLEKSLSSITASISRYDTLISNLDTEILNLSNQELKLKTSIVDISKQLDALSFWVDAFSQKGIRSFIFENSLPELSARAMYYSTILTGGSIGIQILPTTDIKSTGGTKEKLNIVVQNSLGATTYEGCSEGEKRRIDLCLLLALQDLVSSRGSKVWNISIYDELLDSLDNTGITAVIDLFKTESPHKSIFIISHNEALKSYFDSAIVVTKEKGISRIEA